jgi:hypothetical protein
MLFDFQWAAKTRSCVESKFKQNKYKKAGARFACAGFFMCLSHKYRDVNLLSQADLWSTKRNIDGAWSTSRFGQSTDTG